VGGAGQAPDSVPKLVAELAIADHALDVEVDISALDSVGKHAKPQGISTTLRDAVREVEFLSLGGLFDLRGVRGAGRAIN
jgi:hypothetical protein